MASRKPRTGKNINCAYCNTTFYIPKNRFDSAKYCSLKCKGLNENVQIVADCAICNKKFSHISSRVNKAKYCSRKCYHKGQRLNGTVIKACRYCLKEFKSSPSQKRIYCSMSCIGKETLKTFKPKYTTVRKMMIRRNLIKACNRCGYNKYTSILGIHHKDRNRDNNSMENLEVLCPNCHSIEHDKHICQHS